VIFEEEYEDAVYTIEALKQQLAERQQSWHKELAAQSEIIAECHRQLAEAKAELVKANGWRDSWHGAAHTQHEMLKALNADLGAARERERVLMSALVRLESAAEIFMADQSRATDSRCGLVQPVSVAECDELREAVRVARDALQQLDSTKGEGKDGG
jgi:predicted  nucleic acid-binding Zn-ribbon protein